MVVGTSELVSVLGRSVALSRWPRIADSGGVRRRHGAPQAIDFPVCGPWACSNVRGLVSAGEREACRGLLRLARERPPMPQSATIKSISRALRMMKAMRAHEMEWGEDCRGAAADALKGVLAGRMDAAIDHHLAQIAARGEADRRNGSYRRHLLTELGDIALAVPRMRRYSALAVVRALSRSRVLLVNRATRRWAADREINSLGSPMGGAEPRQNPLFLANVTMPPRATLRSPRIHERRARLHAARKTDPDPVSSASGSAVPFFAERVLIRNARLTPRRARPCRSRAAA